MMKIEGNESIRQHDLTKKFEEIFLGGKKADSVDEPANDLVQLERGTTVETEE
jgi:hypothetical protein